MGVCLSIPKKAVKAADEALAGSNPTQNGAHSHGHKHNLRGFLHRLTKEDSLIHLIRHPHHHKFDSGDNFGLDGSFEVVRMIGRGGTGAVFLCKDLRHQGKLVAVKLQQRPVSKVQATMSYNEIVFQANEGEGCVFITPIYEAILTPSHEAQIMEYEGGGTMAEYVAQRVPTVDSQELVIPEDEARYFFKADFQFVYAVAAAMPKVDAHLGTPVYMSPELIDSRYKQEARHRYDPMLADVWACGIWLVAVLVGAFPFDYKHGAEMDVREEEQEIMKMQRTMKWSESPFVAPYISKLSPPCIDLLNKMLEPDPSRRITISAVAMHPWVVEPLQPEYEVSWRRLREQQKALVRSAADRRVDPKLVKERSDAVWEMCSAAEKSEEQEHRRQVLDPAVAKFIDRKTIPHGWRINMEHGAVAPASR